MQAWRDEPKELRAWQRGRTGFPLVDAGMRELWATGWMQQSVRMVCAAFLVEYLSLHWVHGCRRVALKMCPHCKRVHTPPLHLPCVVLTVCHELCALVCICLQASMLASLQQKRISVRVH